MDFEAIRGGEPAALSAFMAAHTDLVWQLARRGFVTRVDERRLWVGGVAEPRELERLTVAIWSEILRPGPRQALTGAEASAAVVLEAARRLLLARAERGGLELTLNESAEEPLPTGVPELEVAGRVPPPEPPNDLDPDDLARFEAARAELERHAASLGARDRALLDQRLRAAEPRSEVATRLGISPPAVKEGERRLTRHLLHHLRRLGLADEHADAARLEALLVGDPRRVSLPPRTAERIRESVLRRSFVEEPRPYASRARVAAITAAVALGLYALMFFGLIPGPSDAPEASPELVLSCEGDCGPGRAATLSLRAPRGARRVALWRRDAAGRAQPLYPASGGRAVALPIGAKERLTPLPGPLTLPEDFEAGTDELVAVFSRERLSPALLAAHVEGRRRLPKVVTHAVRAGP